MLKLSFGYIYWHYTRAIKELFLNIKNFLWFLYNFFSIGLLTSTLFSPWLGLGEKYNREDILNFADHLGAFFVNTIMRLIGAVVRLVVIIFGLILMLCCAIVGFLLIAAWILYPVIIIFFLYSGLRLMIK